jgi:hypothetical protein
MLMDSGSAAYFSLQWWPVSAAPKLCWAAVFDVPAACISYA